jgi:peptide/nickel transport system substrate-binding protein
MSATDTQAQRASLPFRRPRIHPAAVLIAMLAIGLAGRASPQIPDDVLVVGQVAEPKSLDPHVVTALNDFRILVNVYDGLVRFKEGTLEVEPALARSWTISDDGLTYTFRLRRDVLFHDGTQFDAEAVKFNLERMAHESHPFHDTGPFPLAFMLDAIDRVEVADSYTVRLVLEQPYAPLLSNLAYPIGLMVSPSAVREHGAEYGRHPSGSGPFAFNEWISRQRVVLDRNADYWDGPPELETVVFRPLGDDLTRVSELRSGGADLIVEVPGDHIAELRRSPEYRIYESVGPHLWYLILNTREGPFSDRRVRQAANYAVNKRALVDDLLQGTATVAAGPVPAAFEWAYDEELEPYPYDPDRARQLLAEAGYGDGVGVTFYVTQGGSGMLQPVLMGTAIQADLRSVGIEAEIETYEWNTFLDRVNSGLGSTADMAEMAWMTNDPQILPALTLHSDALPEQGGFNSGYYSNPEVDSLLDEARVTIDDAERARLYKHLQRIVHRDAPWVFVASWKQNAVATESVAGFQLEPSFFLRLHHTYKR